ncbi:hypothetical protein ACFLYB_06540 [Chloroflexota bacterium]
MYNINIYVNIGTFVFGGFVFAGIFWLYLKNPEKFERLFYHLYRLLSLIPFLRKKYLYNKIATSIQSDINIGSEIINKQAPGVLPHAVKIEWAKSGIDAEACLRNGEIIVKLSPDEADDRNIVVSVLTYLKKGLLPQARHCIDEALMEATDFTTAKELLVMNNRESAIPYLITEYLEPEISSSPKVGEDFNDLEILHKVGFFTRVFLKQLEFFSKKVFATPSTAIIRQETREFVKFLVDIAEQRNTEVLPSLDFKHPRISVRVLLVAKEITRKWGMKPYINRIKEAQSMGLEYLYMCARGEDNITFTESIARDQEKAGRLQILSRSQYYQSANGNKYPAICIVTALNISILPGTALSSEAIIRSLLEEHVKELKEGNVEIVAVAREAGIMTKITVKPLVEGFDAIRCFVEAKNTGALGIILDQEKFQVLPWHDDVEQMIKTALLFNDHDKITGIEFDNRRNTATVSISDKTARIMALGRRGINVQLASILTGWKIHIKQE